MNHLIHAQRAASEVLERALQGYAQVKAALEEESIGQRPARKLYITPEDGEPILIDLRVRRATRDRRKSTDRFTVWVLDHASTSLRKGLRRRGESYIDLDGVVHLRLPGLVVDRTDLEPVRLGVASDEGRNPFADRASRIARTLLTSPGTRVWTVRQLSAAAQVSYSTGWYATKALEALELIKVDRERKETSITLKDPRLLMSEWVTRYRWTNNRVFHYHAPIGDPGRFLKRLPKLLSRDVRWALTLQAGAHLIAPHATWDRIYFYLDADTEEDVLRLGSHLELEAAEDGRLGIMMPYYKDSVWTGLVHRDALPVVSPVQLALDLWHYPVRGREQAEHLIETVLAPVWDER